MALRVSTNVASLAAQRALEKNSRDVQTSLKRLASGKRGLGPGGDSASFSIGESLRADVAGLKQAKRNTQSAISLAQVAEGGLNEQFNIAVRLRELAVYSASDAVSNKEREFLEEEFQGLVQEFDRIANTTQLGRKKLLNNPDGTTMEFLAGITGKPEEIISFEVDADTTASTLNLDTLSVLDKSDSQETLEEIDNAITELARTRSKFGSVQSRFYHASDNLAVQIENVSEAQSHFLDTDIAEEMANKVAADIRQQASIGILAQANQTPMQALKLISHI